MLILNNKDLETLLTTKEVPKVLEIGFREFKEDRCVTPVRFTLDVNDYQGQFLFMPGYLPGLKQFGTKVISVFPQNPSKRKPTIFASYLLSDPSTGELLALMEASTLTGIRTGGASALATRYLAREDVKVLGIIGTGFQAVFQVKAIRAVRDIEEVWAYDVDRERLENFCRSLTPIIPAHPAVDSSHVIQHADVIVTATTSQTPVLLGKDLKPGIHINAIGAFRPTMREIDEDIVRQATVVVDTFEGCLSEAGDLIIPINEGKFGRERIYSDLGDLITGRKRGRKSPQEVTLFKSVGFAMEDLVVAHMAYQKAIQEGRGKLVEMFES